MSNGEFKIAYQAAKGYFGRVALEVSPGAATGGVEIDFDETKANRWRKGAEFGIEYVLEHVPKHTLFPKGVHVHVACIDGHEVDTNSVVIAYAAAQALLRAIGAQPWKVPEFDKNTGQFIFPK